MERRWGYIRIISSSSSSSSICSDYGLFLLVFISIRDMFVLLLLLVLLLVVLLFVSVFVLFVLLY